jgi:DNA repair ATPase RecN
VVRAVPSDQAAQLLEWRTKLDAARAELEELRPLRERVEELELQLAELEELRPLRGAAEELEALRRAHDILRRRIVAERVAFGEGIAAVQEEVYGSRSWRYTAPMRKAIHVLRRLKP